MTLPSVAIRRLGFSLLDKAQKSPVNKEIARIVHLMSDSPEGELARRQALKRVVAHAVQTVPYYRELDLDPEVGLTGLPVLSKNEIRENADILVSDRYEKNELHISYTTGTTGTPFRILQDTRRRNIRSADTLYFGRLAGFKAGEPLYVIRLWSDRNKVSKHSLKLRNMIPVDVVALSDRELSELAKDMKRRRGRKAIVAYPSGLSRLSKYLHRTDPGALRNAGFGAIITQSEALTEEVRTDAKAEFGVSPLSRYGTEELGIIGQEVAAHSGFVINRAGVYVEILKLDDDVPSAPGELGRIVLTDLNNFGMPMVRYDIGDLGRFRVDNETGLNPTILESVEGRKLDQIFDSEGRHVSSFVFSKCMWKYPQVRQFQIVQHERGRYELRLNVGDAPFDSRLAIAEEFRKYLGANAEIRTTLVDGIPLLRSGKFSQVVNLASRSGRTDGNE